MKEEKVKNNGIDYFTELVKFNEEHGGETYAQSFCIIDDEEDFFESWLDEVSEEKAKEYSDALEIFASADGTGACYAFWFTDGNTDKNKAPIIYYGSEGEIVVVAENIKDLIKMLSFGAECMDGSFSHYIDDEDDFYEEFLEFMPNHLLFREWMTNTLNIEPVSLNGLINDDEEESKEIEALQEKAKKKIKKAFDEWQYQFYPSEEELEREYEDKHQKEYDEKKVELLKEIELKPTAKLYFELAENETVLDEVNYKQRNKYLEKALELDENHKESLVKIGWIYQLSNYKKALEIYSKLIDISDNPEEYYSNIASVYKNLKNYQKAVDYYIKDIETHGGYHGNGYSQKYIIEISQEVKTIDGISILESLEKPNLNTYKVLYEQYFKKKKYEKALENVLLYLTHSKKENDADKFSDKFFKKKRYKEALTILEKTIDKQTRERQKMRNYNDIGRCYLGLNKIDKVLEAFKEAYKIDNEAVSIHKNINFCGSKYLDEKAYEKAISTFQFCIDNNLVLDMAYFNIGASYVLQQEYKKALPYYEKAFKLKPDNKKYKESVNHIEKLLEG